MENQVMAMSCTNRCYFWDITQVSKLSICSIILFFVKFFFSQSQFSSLFIEYFIECCFFLCFYLLFQILFSLLLFFLFSNNVLHFISFFFSEFFVWQLHEIVIKSFLSFCLELILYHRERLLIAIYIFIFIITQLFFLQLHLDFLQYPFYFFIIIIVNQIIRILVFYFLYLFIFHFIYHIIVSSLVIIVVIINLFSIFGRQGNSRDIHQLRYFFRLVFGNYSQRRHIKLPFKKEMHCQGCCFGHLLKLTRSYQCFSLIAT